MKKGVNAVIVGAVIMIAVAAIISVSVMYWDTGRIHQTTEFKSPIAIDVQPVNVSAGTYIVENLDSTDSITLSQLEVTTGEICDFGALITLAPDQQATCTLDVPRTGELIFYAANAQSVIVFAGS